MTTYDEITALAPAPEAFEAAWSSEHLDRILAVPAHRPSPWWRRTRRRAITVVTAGVLTLTTGTAIAVGGPTQVVKDAILDFSRQPNTTGNGLGVLEDPLLVAKFPLDRGGVFAIWVATSSTGKVCSASTDGVWDGEGLPRRDQLEYGCDPEVIDQDDPDHVRQLTRPEQLGGFFKDSDGPLVYGISPYADAARVRVQGTGVDRTLPVREDSHGFGDTLPEASGAAAVTLTFLDAAGETLGTRRYVAPVG